jgi:NAD(P)H-quinone oxidoreductase subunit 5
MNDRAGYREAMDWSLPGFSWLQALALAVPCSFVVGAMRSSRAAPFRAAGWASAAGVALAAAFAVGLVVAPELAGAPSIARVDGVTATMLLLVCGLGLVVVRFSRTYLAGDPGQPRYARWLLATLAAVTALVTANNLLVIAAAWTLTSLALHKLLTYYGDRPAALVAAHKKFLVSRLADACLWSALALIYRAVGSLQLDTVAAWLATHDLPVTVRAAAALCVVAAALKSAQIPFHGWLTQVMEAPTPVSALLHAGVVNLGGFLMIRLAPLMAHAPAAQLLLVVIGMVTAVLAALIASTRVSVKVALAWSTCAQMGFMLVQCGLGLWHLALLHLVAHSLYKAHAFLAAGGAVDAWRLGTLAPPPPRPSPGRLVASTAAALGVAALAVWAGAASMPSGAVDLPVAALALVVALSLVPMLAQRAASLPVLAARALGVAALYAAWHVGAGRLWPAPASAEPSPIAWAIVVAGLGALFGAQSLITVRPHGRFARTLHTWLFAGLYLDERFTRLTFRVWPPRLPRPAAPRVRPVAPMEVSS